MITVKKTPWVEKYRPRTIDDIISHQNIRQSIQNFIATDALPHIIMYGPSGSGKTTIIRCIADTIYQKNIEFMTKFLNASDERGIDTIRNKIKKFVQCNSMTFVRQHMRKTFKMVILDEIDSMTHDAQNALRQIIEDNSATTRFCLICNDIDKIIVPLQSRCVSYRFSPIQITDSIPMLRDISQTENMCIDQDAIHAIAEISCGDMRCAINILQQANMIIQGQIKQADIYVISGHCSPQVHRTMFAKLCRLYTSKSAKIQDCVQIIHQTLIDRNITLANFIETTRCMVVASDMSVHQKVFIINILAMSEISDASSVDYRSNIISIASAFLLSRQHTSH